MAEDHSSLEKVLISINDAAKEAIKNQDRQSMPTIAGLYAIIHAASPQLNIGEDFVLQHTSLRQWGKLLISAEQYTPAEEVLSYVIDACPKHYEAWFDRGHAKSLQGRLDEALEDLNQAINLQHREVSPYLLRGDVHRELRDFESAIADYSIAIKNAEYHGGFNTVFIEGHLKRGFARINNKEDQKAVEDASVILKSSPRHTGALQLRALAYANLQQFDEAIKDYTRVINNSDFFVEAYVGRGRAHFYTDKLDKAIRDLETALEKDPCNIAALDLIAQAHSEVGNLEEAMKSIDTAISLIPNIYGLHIIKADIHLKQGEHDLALEEYNVAVELNPHSSTAVTQRGIFYHTTSQDELAKRDFDKAIELNPKNKRAWHSRSLVSLSQSEYIAALGDIDKAIALDPQFENAYIDKGTILTALGRYQDAFHSLQHAKSLRPESLTIQNHIAEVHRELQEPEKADEILDAILAEDPNNYQTINIKVAVLSDMGDFETALTYVKKMLELNPTSEIAWSNKGLCHYALGDHKAALESIDRSSEIRETTSNLAIKASVLEKMGRMPEAKECYLGALNGFEDLRATRCLRRSQFLNLIHTAQGLERIGGEEYQGAAGAYRIIAEESGFTFTEQELAL